MSRNLLTSMSVSEQDGTGVWRLTIKVSVYTLTSVAAKVARHENRPENTMRELPNGPYRVTWSVLFEKNFCPYNSPSVASPHAPVECNFPASQ